MKRRFQVLIEGTARSNPDEELTKEGALADIKKAVEASIKLDLQWGVTVQVYDVNVLEAMVNRT